MEFRVIKTGLENHLDQMTKENMHLFVVDLDKDELWNLYLNSIPEEDNQIFRVRREYDCSCCRHFIKSIGNVVSIKDGVVSSIWDFETEDSKWNKVVSILSEFVKSKPVKDVYISKVKNIGTNYNMEQTDDGKLIKWEHFYCELPEKFVFNNTFSTIDTETGNRRDIRNVFKRSLDELSMDAVDTVMDLINQGSLYKGDEYRHILQSFRLLKKEYDKLDEKAKELYAWEKSVITETSVAKIRNTALGTLLIDVSANVDLEEAVRKYEVVTAPANYKRSKPIFTKKMLEDAKKTITELGYLDSLERRYANADDITVNNILFSNKDVSSRIQGAASLFDELERDAKSSPKKFDRVEEISIDKFVKDVLPTASKVEAYVENKHIKNFVSLIAPVNKDSKSMFKWNNNFSWAYTGNVTDSMVKENVKNAGGKVDGVLRFSIQWNDLDDWDENDLDAHCIEPDGNEIYYSSKTSRISGGQLDIDIINPENNKAAVENITWQNTSRMREGKYIFLVHCYTYRGGRSGFRAEIEFDGQIYSFDYRIPLKQSEKVVVAEVTFKNGKFTIEEKLPSNCSNKEVWGIKTNDFTPVTVICNSPNYWDEQIGNKHWFFMLKDCINSELPNAYYNEFLNSELYPQHRKVMEALSSKAHVLETDDQLSGIGFSSTIRNELIVRVTGATERILKIKF